MPDDVVPFEKAKRARAKIGEPKPADVRAAIRALKPGSDFLGIPPWWQHGEGGIPNPDETGLPPHCPVTPLGRDGDTFYFLNAAGGLGELTPSASGKGHIDALFSGAWPYLVWAWGRVKHIKGGVILPQDNYDAEKVRTALFDAATAKGNWNAVDRVRGRGAWIGDRGELILHLGDHLLVDGETREPCGERDGYLYPGQPPLPAPAAGPVAAEGGPGGRILELLETWHWSRPEIDPLLMLGWIGQAMVGGALTWRSSVFVTGDAATGKSTLQKFVSACLGHGLISAVETTAAGVYQQLGHDSLPVAIDEMEASAQHGKTRAVIELARVAASGGRMLRGGQDHNGRQFVLLSPFFFSAINAPGLDSQDRSRLAMLRLRPLHQMEGGEPLDFLELVEAGRALHRRVIDWWPRFDSLRVRIRDWLIEEAGHDGRGADTFGTLVAFSHIALDDDEISDARLTWWCDRLEAASLGELESRTDNWKLCLRHLLEVRPDALRQASKEFKTVGGMVRQFQPGDWNDHTPCHVNELKSHLAMVGLGLVGPKRGAVRHDNGFLVVPNDHSALAPCFDGTKWGGEGGMPGIWPDALRQSPMFEEASQRGLHLQGTGRVGGVVKRGTLIFLANLFDMVGDGPVEGGDDDAS